MRDVLARDLGARDVVVGYDFSFGRGRAGNGGVLHELGAAAGIGVAVIPPVAIDGVPCSSTRVRELVAAGDAAAAAQLLGRPFELEGAVVARRGPRAAASASRPRTSRPEGELRPKLGIYAARARVLDGPLAGTARTGRAQRRHESVSFRGDAVTVEAYLLDFEGDLYDRRAAASRSASACATSAASSRSTR